MRRITIETAKHKQVIDITARVQMLLKDAPANTGLVHLFVLHATASLTVADLDPGTDLDMLDAFEAMIPKLDYRHPHDPSHVGDHIMSAIIGPSLLVPFENGELVLGQWQRIVLIELTGPRPREIIASFIREA